MGKVFTVVYAVLATLSLSSNTSYAANGALGDINIPSEMNRYGYALPQTPDHVSDPSHNAAVTFVRSAGLHKSLSLLLLDSVKTDALVEKAISRYGFDSVKNMVVANIKSTATDYRDQWDNLLATLYSSQFDAHILQSICDKGENSPYFVDFISKQKQMGTSDTLHSSDIFKAARSELIKTLEKSFAI